MAQLVRADGGDESIIVERNRWDQLRGRMAGIMGALDQIVGQSPEGIVSGKDDPFLRLSADALAAWMMVLEIGREAGIEELAPDEVSDPGQ